MKALKIISDLLPIPSYTVIIICFFFPFLTIKCNTTELVSVTGFDYVIGNDVKDKMEKSEMAKTIKEKMGKDMFDSKLDAESDSLSEDGETVNDGVEEEAGNLSGLGKETKDEKMAKVLFFFIMTIPLVMALLGLIMAFTKSKKKGLFHIIFSTVGFVFLLAYGIMIKSSEDINSISSMGEGIGGMISIDLGSAYYIATIFFLIIIMFFAMVKYLKNLYQEEQQIREESLEEFYSKEEF